MVHPQESRANWNERQRIAAQEEPSRVQGRAPYAGEVVGGRQHPPFEVKGLDALSPILAHVPFPARKADVLAAIGGARIAIDQVKTVSVADILSRVAPERFETSMDLEAAAQRIIREMQPHYEDGRGAHHRQTDNVSGRRPG